MSDFFITGTDTDIGKTYITSLFITELVAQGQKVIGMKPIASGFEKNGGEWINEDVTKLTSASNVELPNERINRYSFKLAIAPHLAAQAAGQRLDLAKIREDFDFCKQQADHVLVEAVGGWLVPLSGADQDYQDVAGFAEVLQIPVILVVGIRLGCLNHALLTYKAILASGLPFAGWVANCCDADAGLVDENIETLLDLIEAPLLATVPYRDRGKDLSTHNYFADAINKILKII